MALFLSIAALLVVGAAGALAAHRMSSAGKAPVPNNELLSVQRAAAMQTTAAEGHAYLQAVLRGSGRIPMLPRTRR